MPQTINLTVQEQPPVGLTTEQARVINAVSPTATVERVSGGVEITTHDINGTTTAMLYDGATGAQGPAGPAGQDGQPGRDGVDGVSPTASVTQTATGATVTVTDASGTTTATLTNGPQGPQGPAGADYVLTAQDKADIADIVLSELPTWTGGSY